MKPSFRVVRGLPSLLTISLAFSVLGASSSSLQAQGTSITYANPAAVTQNVSSTSGSSTLTVADGTKYALGDIIRFSAAASSPFGSVNNYYIVSVSGNNITVASTPGGTALNATATQSAAATQLSQSISIAANWTGGNVPDTNSEIANFASPSSNVPAFILTSNQTVYGVNQSGSGSDLVLASGANGTGFYTLTFATHDGSTPKISGSSTSRVITLGTTGTGASKLQIAGTQGLIFNGRVGGAITGAGTAAVSTNPDKNIRLTNIDWSGFSGGITVERGEASIQGALGALPNQTLTVGNAQTTANNTLAHLAMGGTGAIVDGLNGTSLGRISGASTLSVGNADGSGNYAGVIGRGMVATETATNLVKNGSGTQTISGIMVGTGNVTVNEGVLAFSGANTFTGTTTVNDGGTLSLSGSLAGGGAIAVNGTGILSQSAAGVIGGASGITLSGSGTSTLSGANTYTGLTTINSGTTLKLGNALALGSAGLGGDETALSSGGILDLNGQSTAESFTNIAGSFINSNTSTAAQITTDLVDLGNATFDGPGDIIVSDIRRTNSITRRTTKNGTGTLTLGGDQSNNRYGLTVNEGNVILAKTAGEAVGRFELIMNNAGGTVTLQNKGDQIADNGDIVHKINAGTLDLNGFNEGISAIGTSTGTEPGGIVTNSNGSTTSTLTLLGATTDVSWSGAITGNLNLVKQGTNVQTLDGANTYTGGTLISGGTLALGANGSLDNTTGVSLGTSGTFDVSAKSGYTVNNLVGSGTVVGALTVSTTLAIGNSPGTTDFNGDLTLTAGTTYAYEMIGGTSSADLGNVTGTLDLGGATLSLSQFGAGVYTPGDKFTLFSYSTGLIGTFNGLADLDLFTDAGGIWQINYNDTAGLNGGDFVSNVTITAVPEPGAALLGGLGLLALLRRRR